MNCHHFMATQKSIPDAQELIWLGGGVKRPPPAPLGLMLHSGFLTAVAVGNWAHCCGMKLVVASGGGGAWLHDSMECYMTAPLEFHYTTTSSADTVMC